MKTKVKEEERGKKENNNNNKHTHKKPLLAFFVEVFAFLSITHPAETIIKEKERARYVRCGYYFLPLGWLLNENKLITNIEKKKNNIHYITFKSFTKGLHT